MAFDAIKKLAEGVPDYLEVPVEAGLLDKATAIINGLGYEEPDTIAMAMALLVIENTHLREVIHHLRDTISGLTDHNLL